VSKSFSKKSTKKSKTDFFLIFFYHVFGRFSVRGVQKHDKKSRKKIWPALVLFWPPRNQPTTPRSVTFFFECPLCLARPSGQAASGKSASPSSKVCQKQIMAVLAVRCPCSLLATRSLPFPRSATRVVPLAASAASSDMKYAIFLRNMRNAQCADQRSPCGWGRQAGPVFPAGGQVATRNNRRCGDLPPSLSSRSSPVKARRNQP
jgi:hypothetical protein